jgi:diguanylate cyclase (GGDEF)-like protein
VTAPHSPHTTPDEVAQVHAMFVERTWRAVALVSVMALIGLPLRSLMSGRPLEDLLLAAMLMPLGFLVAYLWRRRMPQGLYERTPLWLFMTGSGVASVLTGMQGNGIVFFVMSNVLAAMVLPKRQVKWVLSGSLAWVSLVGLAYVNGWLPVRTSPQYATNPMVWAYAVSTVSLLAYVVIIGISDHQESLKRLMHEVMAQREEIARLANHDALTGLPSLRLARDRLEMACSQATRHRKKAAALFVDLDGFKGINDSMGHKAGDEVLKMVAVRLQSRVRGMDTVARLGGDEFLVILNGIDSMDDAERVATKLHETLVQPIHIHAEPPHTSPPRQAQVGASIGIALFPDEADTPEGLLAVADRAMYAMKHAHRAA